MKPYQPPKPPGDEQPGEAQTSPNRWPASTRWATGGASGRRRDEKPIGVGGNSAAHEMRQQGQAILEIAKSIRRGG